MTIVVIGSGSMIAQALRRHDVARHWRYLPHQAALDNTAWVRDADCVINLAFDPRLKSRPYDPAFDVDQRLAHLLADYPARYVMISTRMVYGTPPQDGRLAEDMAPDPVNHYGRAKRRIEHDLAARFADRLTILRLSNIFDPSEAFGERRSFFGMALRGLITQGRIVFDMSPFVARDFLPADVLADCLAAIVARPTSGVFNVGAGFAVPTGRIAQWLIAGFGKGRLEISDFREHDGFWLDMAWARNTWDLPPVTDATVRDHCLKLAEHAAGRK